MNHSIYSVDRTTHLKIVALALTAATVFAGLGIAAHSRDSSVGAGIERVSVIKPGQPAIVAFRTQLAVR